MKSRLLSNLEAEVSSASSETARLEGVAKQAFYYACLGDDQQMSRLVREVRSLPVHTIGGRGVVWLNLAEGIAFHYEGKIAEACQKWERAIAVASSVSMNGLASIGSAWLAFSAYLSEDLPSLERRALEAAAAGSECSEFAVSRLALTLGLCVHYCGDTSAARDWYSVSRMAALDLGDETAVAALIHSAAWMSVSVRRNQEMRGMEAAPFPQLSQLNTQSAESYESLVGAMSASAMTPLLSAQSDLLEGKWNEALQKISANLDSTSSYGFGRLQPGLLADRSLCLAQVGRQAESLEDAQRAMVAARSHSQQRDDRAVLHSRLAQIFKLLGHDDQSAAHGRLAEDAWTVVAEFQRAMREVLLRVLDSSELQTLRLRYLSGTVGQ